jgi:hypothetical protein
MPTKTLLPWPGGKPRLLLHLVPLIEATPNMCYVEAFAGGAAVLFAREPAKVEVLHDLNGDLVCLYRVVTHHAREGQAAKAPARAHPVRALQQGGGVPVGDSPQLERRSRTRPLTFGRAGRAPSGVRGRHTHEN